MRRCRTRRETEKTLVQSLYRHHRDPPRSSTPAPERVQCSTVEARVRAGAESQTRLGAMYQKERRLDLVCGQKRRHGEVHLMNYLIEFDA
jgi:hypothetical protein